MRLAVAISIAVVVSFNACAQSTSETYWLLFKNDERTWCGYTDMAEFTSEAGGLITTESARASYSSGKLMEITYQVQPESGDWVVIDKFMLSESEILIRRASLLVQENLQIIQEAKIHSETMEPFRVVSITTLDGKETKASGIETPVVSVRTSLSQMPFAKVLEEMRLRSIGKLCSE